MQNARERHLTSKEIVALTFSEPRKILSTTTYLKMMYKTSFDGFSGM